MSILTAPAGALTDGVVALRLPSPDAGDITTIDGYIEDDQLDGGWLPEVPLVTAQQLVADWLDGWAGRQSRNGPAFAVTVAEGPGFVGVVGMTTPPSTSPTGPHPAGAGKALLAAQRG
jgi:hypothetical protein